MRRIFLTTCLIAINGLSCAGDIGHAQDLWQPQFMFMQQDAARTNEVPLRDRQHSTSARLSQYNATLSHPWGNNGMQFGLGVNLRFIEGDLRDQTDTTRNINTTVPMLYASALFSLPLEGLKASVTGSHMDYEQWRAYDYRAKLVYSFDSRIGLQGGWKQQSLDLDTGLENKSRFEEKGPFLDFFWRF